jgi:actin-related protein
MIGTDSKDLFVGDEVIAKREFLHVNYPIKSRVVENWDDMEKLWEHTFHNELHVAPEDQCVLLTEPALNPKANREKTLEIMFETFDVPGMQLSRQPVLALYGSGRSSGVVVDIGHDRASTLPVYQGYSLPHAVHHLDIGGKQLTDFLTMILAESGHSAAAAADRDVVRDIKEKLCFVSLDYKADSADTASVVSKDYELPDGKTISLGKERFRAAEALFDPSLAGVAGDGICTMVNESISKCEVDIRSDLWSNVVFAGGSTMFPGLFVRVTQELTEMTPASVRVKVVASPQRKHLTWFGGAVLAALLTSSDGWITRETYDERGAALIHDAK